MKQVKLGGVSVPAVAVGCMRMNGSDKEGRKRFIAAAMDGGMNFFDHADIYGGGACETLFGEAVKEMKIPRDKMFLQSKCGIVPGKMFDFSERHITESVEGSLRRLGTDHLDCLILHRPDTLAEPEEVAAAFDKLEKAGKVRMFGVSNMHPAQIELLKSAVRQPIVCDQLQFSPVHASMISCGIEANMQTGGAVSRDGYVLEYCRLHGVTIQAWSPYQYGFFEGVYLKNDKFSELNKVIGEIGEKYGIEDVAVVAAWILRHPAGMQMVTGTMNEKRLAAVAAGASVVMTREEWYRIYIAAGHILP